MMKHCTKLGFIPLLTIMILTSCTGQEIHPYKEKFIDFQSWPATAPGDFTFDNFTPYRAVYSRTYTHHKTGETVNDQVIMTAQRVFWYGKNAILFEVHDVGTPEVPDTNGRTQFYYLDEKTLELFLAVGPKAGTPQDYTSVRVLDKKIVTSKLNTETGKVETSEFKTQEPTFGFRQIRFLMWAAMDLNVGNKIKLFPNFNAPAAEQIPVLGIVKEQSNYTTPNGEVVNAYVVENTNNPMSAIVNKFYVSSEAPYLLAQGLYNADDDEIYRWWYKLESWEKLDGK